MNDTSEQASTLASHTEHVGAFDVRNFIAALIGLFGLVCLVMGLFFFNDTESARTGGVNANLWAGLGMIVFAAIFFLWAKLQPITIVVSENEPGAEDPKDIAPAE